MRILTIRTQRDAAAARTRLIDATASPELALQAEALLKAANPHLDLDNLEPGAVVLVPDAPEFSREHTEELRGADLEAASAAVKEGLQSLDARTKASALLNGNLRDAVLKDLRSRPVKAIEDRLPEVKPDLERLRRVIAAEVRDDKAQRSEFEQVVKRATADFEELRRRFG